MRPLTWLLSVLLAALSAAMTTRSNHPRPTVRVLTYNIHHGEGADGQWDLPRIAGVITEAAPDLVALQEVDEATARSSGVRQASELGRLTGLRAVFGQAMPFRGGGYGVGVLSRYPVLSVVNHSLPVAPDREPRTALSVTVQPAAGMPPIVFTSTHLDFGRGDRRTLQAQVLNDTLAADEERIAILGGDLNSGDDSEVLRILRDRWDEVVVPGPTAMDGSGRLIFRLDYLLLRPTHRWRVLEASRLDSMASDHLPVLAVLELANPLMP
jgi:endonuclease/exonuclease/phosphatase family metal-dependent hydrolase